MGMHPIDGGKLMDGLLPVEGGQRDVRLEVRRVVVSLPQRPRRAGLRARTPPARRLARFRVLTVCGLVAAALEARMRQALQHHGAPVPPQQGQPGQNPTARWVVQYVVAIHVLLLPQQWPLVLNLTEEHQHLLRLLSNPDMRFSDVKYS
jgi:hypothetical protein